MSAVSFLPLETPVMTSGSCGDDGGSWCGRGVGGDMDCEN